MCHLRPPTNVREQYSRTSRGDWPALHSFNLDTHLPTIPPSHLPTLAPFIAGLDPVSVTNSIIVSQSVYAVMSVVECIRRFLVARL